LRKTRRWGASLLALGLVVGSAQPASAAPEPADRTGTDSAGSVTLITGDQVVLVGDQVDSIIPGRDRERVVFSAFTADGRQYVVPEDAKPLLVSGKLDRRLFDVTGLLAAHYDDAHRDSVPLIVTPAPGGSVAGLARTADLPVVGSFAARAAKATAADSWCALTAAPDGYRKIWLDGLRHPALDRSTAQIGAPDAWKAGATTARTTVFRDGVEVGESAEAGTGQFEVPATAGSYRVEVEATRSEVSDVSTKVGAAWTFRSAHEGDEERRLPLSVLRFQPELDAANAAPAGRLLRVPLVVEQNPGADNGKIRRIAVEASFDDGATWREVPVVGDSTFVRNGKAGFASLRAKATDSQGNTSETTVIRAYKITGE